MQHAKYLGILNITPDSFSDGSEHFQDPLQLLLRAEELMKSGAFALDIGAESTRPDAEAVSIDEEYQRLENFLKVFCAKYDFPLSIDTRKYEIMESLLKDSFFSKRIHFLNDVEAFQNEAKLDLIAKHDRDSLYREKIKLIAMHSKGGVPPLLKSTEIPDDFYSIDYPSLSSETAALKQSFIDFFSQLLKNCRKYQIEAGRLILDPGLGFGKNLNHSFALIEMIPDLRSLFNVEILIGASRKSFLKAAMLGGCEEGAGIGVREQSDDGTAHERASSRLRKTNNRSVISSDAETCETNVSYASKRKYKLRLPIVHEDYEADENAGIGVREQCLDLATKKYNQLCYEAGARYFRVHRV